MRALRGSQAARYGIMILMAVFFLTPLAWTFSSSLRQAHALFEFSSPFGWRTFVPPKITLDHYRYVFTRGRMGLALRNSFFVSLSTVVLGVVVNSLAGFAFAKYAFPGRDALFVMVLITFMVPFEAIVIPLFLTVDRLGWLNTYYALILPAVANGLSIFVFRQFFQEFPDELIDAARVDGASAVTVFARIVIPLSLPVFATVAVMTFLSQWDAFFWPLVAASAPGLEVVQVNVSRAITFEQTFWGQLFASSTVASLIPMLLFGLLQRYYVRGIIGAGIK